MKLFKSKTPANDYVVTVRNGERITDDEVRPEQDAAKLNVEDTDAEALERMGLAMKLPGPDPGPDRKVRATDEDSPEHFRNIPD